MQYGVPSFSLTKETHLKVCLQRAKYVTHRVHSVTDSKAVAVGNLITLSLHPRLNIHTRITVSLPV